MDTSKEYIEMCEKAVEIQKSWKHTAGDYFIYYNGEWVLINKDTKKKKWKKETGYYIFGMVGLIEGNLNIWLPRQDQLQEMVNEPQFLLGEKFHRFVYIKYGVYCANFNSFEQLWLAFVMKEKYNKTWNNNNWEN